MRLGRLGLAGIGLGLALALHGCMKPKGWQGPPPAADEDQLDFAANEPWFIVVRTTCRTLDVYRLGERVRSYPAVFGMGGIKGKEFEGDHRTPTGLYAIIGKRHHGRWRRFMLLDYPNERDMRRYATALAAGTVPMLGDRPAGVGAAIGIHGTDKPRLNRLKVDWTWGCISLDNQDVVDLANLVPLGTPVLIE